MTEVQVPAPLSHQVPAVISEALRKLLRCGRRWGKTRIAFYCAIVGHGPEGHWKKTIGRDEGLRHIEWHGPLHRGIAQGFDVFWIARDIPQSKTLWHEEILPRFEHKEPGVTVNKTDKRIEFRGGGKLWIRSAENIASVRGAGGDLAGVIVDEAAYQDLEDSLRNVLLPALLDNEGWLILMSTTNAGKDGNQELRTPSYFNVICEEIQAGKRGPEWEEFYGTPHDNPVLSQGAIDALIAEYDPDSIELAQEVYAKLVQGGAGLAFPEWDDDVHITRTQPEETHTAWRWAAGMDWGYTAPGWFGLFASSSERSVLRWEHYYREQSPYQVGYTLGQALQRFPPPEWIALDSAAWAVTDGGPTVAEEIQRGLKDAIGHGPGAFVPSVIAAPKGPGSRISGKLLLHDVLRYKKPKDGEALRQWERPKLLVHEDCENVIRTLPRLPRDEKNPEDVDTHAEDHPYDGIRYWLMARAPQVEEERPDGWSEDQHPGFTKAGRRARPWAVGEDEPSGPRWQRTPAGITLDTDGGYVWE